MKPKQSCPSTSQQTMYCYVTSLAAQPLLSMHARLLYTLPLLLLGLGYHIIIITIVVDDMIIIIMLTIFDEGWKVQAIPPRRFVPFESPKPRVPGIGFLASVPNRVWVVMGSPFLTYLASNISSGGPS